MPVDWYNGGMEHTTLHVLYSRFWNKFLYDQGLVPVSEPYFKRTSHGMVLGEGGEKMSKSRGNVLNPDEVVTNYGADVFRIYEMFIGPFDQAAAWDTKGIAGIDRFLKKIYRNFVHQDTLSEIIQNTEPDTELKRIMHQSIINVSRDLEGLHMNTAVSQLMIFLNEITAREVMPKQCVETFVLLLSPFAPHISEEIWSLLGHPDTLAYEKWPEGDRSLAAAQQYTLVVQINGKIRARLTVPADISKQDMLRLSKEQETIKKLIAGKQLLKEITVPGKLVNLVIKG